MSRTIKDMPYWLHQTERYKVKLTNKEKKLLVSTPPRLSRRNNKVGSAAYEAYKKYQDNLIAIQDKIDSAPGFRSWYTMATAPKHFRKDLTQARRHEAKQYLQTGKYDDIPKYRRDAAWLWW